MDGEWENITYESLYPSSDPVPKYAPFNSIARTWELREEERVPGEYRFYLSTYDGHNGVSVEERFFIVGYYTIKE